VLPHGKAEQNSVEDTTIQEGTWTQARVVGLLDILGFKGIWNQHDPRAVLAQMKHLRAQALPLLGHRKTGVLLRDEGFRHDVKFISDTLVIVVTLSHSEIPERFLYRALHSAYLIAGDIIDEAASGTPAFTLRGCLAAGAKRERPKRCLPVGVAHRSDNRSPTDYDRN